MLVALGDLSKSASSVTTWWVTSRPTMVSPMGTKHDVGGVGSFKCWPLPRETLPGSVTVPPITMTWRRPGAMSGSKLQARPGCPKRPHGNQA